jgi:hypothetical protein
LSRGSSASRCLIDSVEAKILRSLYAFPLHARRQGVLLLSSTDANLLLRRTRIAALKGLPAGTERDIPNIAGGFLRAWARPVNAPKRSAAARRSAPFAERSLTGRARARTLFPLRNGSVTVAAKPTADARAGSFFPKCLSNSSRVAARLPRSPRPIWPRSWDQKRCSPSRATVSYSIPYLAWSLPQRVAPEPESMTGQTPDKSPDAHRMPLARRRQRLRCRILRNL